MSSIVFNIFDPATHNVIFNKDDFTFLAFADFDTGTTAGAINISPPTGSQVVIQQSAPPGGRSNVSTVTQSGNTVSWTAGSVSTRVRVFIR